MRAIIHKEAGPHFGEAGVQKSRRYSLVLIQLDFARLKAVRHCCEHVFASLRRARNAFRQCWQIIVSSAACITALSARRLPGGAGGGAARGGGNGVAARQKMQRFCKNSARKIATTISRR